MRDFRAIGARLPLMVRALAVGVPAGAFLDWLDTPIPWMIGPMVGVALLNLCGIRALSIPTVVRQDKLSLICSFNLLHPTDRCGAGS